MSQEKSNAEELLTKADLLALAATDDKVSDSEKENLWKNAVTFLEQALNVGLPRDKEIQAHKDLGVLYYDLAESPSGIDTDAIIEHGLDQFPLLSRSVFEREKALILDAQTGGQVYGNSSGNRGKRLNLYLLLFRLGYLWGLQTYHLSRKAGKESAVSYLQEKMKMLDYLGGAYLPDVSFLIGALLVDIGNKEAGIYWFKRAISADDFGDISRESDGYKFYQSQKESARGNIEYLTSPPEGSSQNKGGCFIATAVYGSALASEVIIFSRFRDEFLLPSRIGKLFVGLYYCTSPFLASRIARIEFLRKVIRVLFLMPILRLLKAAKFNS